MLYIPIVLLGLFSGVGLIDQSTCTFSQTSNFGWMASCPINPAPQTPVSPVPLRSRSR